MKIEYIPETPAEYALIERYQYLKTVRNMDMNFSEWLTHIGVTIEHNVKELIQEEVMK